MTSDRRSALEEILQTELQIAMRSLEGHPPEEDCNEVELEILEMAAQRIEQVERAMGELERGTYGICLNCKKEISERRLRGLPFVRICLPCDTRTQARYVDERRAAQNRSRPGDLFSAMCT